MENYLSLEQEKDFLLTEAEELIDILHYYYEHDEEKTMRWLERYKKLCNKENAKLCGRPPIE